MNSNGSLELAKNDLIKAYSIDNKNDRWDSGKPRRQQILFCDIRIKLVISRSQIYVYHTDLLALKI